MCFQWILWVVLKKNIEPDEGHGNPQICKQVRQKCRQTSDAAQKMVPQNITSQHIGYFKMKETEKTVEAGRSV